MGDLQMIDVNWFETFANAILAICTGGAAILGIIVGSKKAGKASGAAVVSEMPISVVHVEGLRSSIERNTKAVKENTERIETATGTVISAITDLRLDLARLR